jgi:hypothetical protein
MLALRIAVLALLTAALPGQTPQTQPGTQAIRPELIGKDVVFDRVRAICGDSVVTQSAAREGVLRTLRGSPTRLSDERIEELELRAVQDEVRTRLYAGLVRTLDDSGMVEQRIEYMLQDYIKRQTEAAGSQTGFMKGLEQSGITFGQFVEDKRTEFSRDLYIHEVLRRKVDIENQRYVVTPAEMREYYRIHRDRFARPASADVAAVLLPRSRATVDADAVTARAELAAGKDPQIVAKGLGGNPAEWKDIREQSSHQADVRSFALSHKAGEVGGPFPLESFLAVVRITARVEGRAGGFEDPSVQDQISKELRGQKLQRLERQLAQERLLGAFIWPIGLLQQ